MCIKKDTIIRSLVLVVALVNQVLICFGKDIIPWSDDQIYNVCSTAFTAITAIVAWWKNNSFTPFAIAADKYMEAMKGDDFNG